jgi:hypothetical protein
LEEYSIDTPVDVVIREKLAIQILKPVLNSQVPKDCINYMRKIESATDAIVLADQNGYWNFDDHRKIW